MLPIYVYAILKAAASIQWLLFLVSVFMLSSFALRIMASVVRELENNRVNYFILHIGQHYWYNLEKVLEIEKPNVVLGEGDTNSVSLEGS
jgi:hypothetical protein